MNSNFQIMSLAELSLDVSYGYTESAQNKPVGPRFLRITDIQCGVVDWPSVPYCTIDSRRLPNYLLQSGDIVVARTGNSTGENYIFDSTEQVVFASYLIRFRIDHSKANPLFVWYQLRTQRWWDFVAGSKTGSAQAGANAQVLGRYKIFLPSRYHQDRIAEQLRRIDDKIALNRRINQTLEAMAQAIFKSWFVDFDPVKAKIAALAEGRDPLRAAMSAISGKPEEELDTLPTEGFEQLAATAALFPDEMVESELGDIPKGWASAPISDIADVVMGQSPDGETYNDAGVGMALINGPVEFDVHHPKCIKWTTQPTKISQSGDLIVCVRGSTTGKFVKSDGVYCLGRGVCAIRARESSWQPFLDQTYKGSLPKLLSLATGSTFPNWSGPTLKSHRILKPVTDVVGAYAQFIQPALTQISSNDGQIRSLQTLRDTLLPKLLSGELCVSEIPTEYAK